MATAEEANEFLSSLAADVDQRLSAAGPRFAFSMVFWFRGEPDNPKGMAIMVPLNARADQRAALLRAASLTPDLRLQPVEMHGLDTSQRVCFYEQDFYPLSNFSAFGIMWRGVYFPTVEHAYHWEKFADRSGIENQYQATIRSATSAHGAFKFAQEHKDHRDPRWDARKVEVMAQMLRSKVDGHEYVRRKLLATDDRELVENSWRDDFWGWGPNRDGQNVLGKLWMELRAELREAS